MKANLDLMFTQVSPIVFQSQDPERVELWLYIEVQIGSGSRSLPDIRPGMSKAGLAQIVRACVQPVAYFHHDTG